MERGRRVPRTIAPKVLRRGAGARRREVLAEGGRGKKRVDFGRSGAPEKLIRQDQER